MKSKGKLKIGDKVIWKGSYGMDVSKVVTVEYIENEKKDEELDEIDWELVDSNKIIIGLNNNHWAYGFQIKKK